jgi:hypothetical protein
VRADLESGTVSRCDRPDSLVASVEIPTLNVARDPLIPALDRRFYILTLRGEEVGAVAGKIACRERLGGMLRYYYRDAA